MERKFNETNIPSDLSKSLARLSWIVPAEHAYKIVNSLFTGISNYLAGVKNTKVPKGVVMKSKSNEFMVGAKVEFFTNEEDSTNPSAGRWDYVWTTDEDDMKGVDVIDAFSNNPVIVYIKAAAHSLYNMKFAGTDSCVACMTTAIEMIMNWLRDNTTAAEEAVLVLDNCFKAVGQVEDGKLFISIIPDGSMKVLIKDDTNIQEN